MKQNSLSRRGMSRHESNPFITSAIVNTKTGTKKISNTDGNRMMIVSEGSGEIMAPAGFWHAQEVDKTKFVKLYINGVKAFSGMSSAGAKVFEVLYLKVQLEINKDMLHMHFNEVGQELTPMSRATFMRGMRELVSKGFLAESTVPGKYYLNPDYMWNGDRLAFVQTYTKTAG